MEFFHPERLDMYVVKFVNFFLYDFWTFLERLLIPNTVFLRIRNSF